MGDDRRVEVRLLGEGQLQHHLPIVLHPVQFIQQSVTQKLFGFGFRGRADQNFRLDDRHQSVIENLRTDLELLRHVRVDALRIRLGDDRARLGAEDTLARCAVQRGVEIRHRLEHLHTVGLGLQALVDLQERNDAALGPKVFRCRGAVDLAVHRHLEEDGANHLLAGKRRRRRDPRPHGVDQVEHLGLGAIGAFIDTILLERLGRGTTGLIQRGNETRAFLHLCDLIDIAHGVLLQCC
mmetsp:Transcript_3497/g.6240  ORF Transcript_3497/g.6240 Transcript_3497/m.6240 type:complete len:238 (-) Transcript_3497:334-1047(-)